MAQLVKIGNSKGIRIPKALIEQAHLEGKELKFQLLNDGLLIVPEKNIRDGWKDTIEQTINAIGQEPIDTDWLDFPINTDDDLEW